MKRWLAHLGIGAYLLALATGFVTHAFDFGTDCHPIMYFLVWDMFCGWSGYEGRMQLIGEGESGKFYELAPGPWGEFHPYGFIDRHHYDPEPRPMASCWPRTALSTPCTSRWCGSSSSKRNTRRNSTSPTRSIEAYYGKPKEFHSYYHTRFIITPHGRVISQQPTWFTVSVSPGDRRQPSADQRRVETGPSFRRARSPFARGLRFGTLLRPSSSSLSARNAAGGMSVASA